MSRASPSRRRRLAGWLRLAAAAVVASFGGAAGAALADLKLEPPVVDAGSYVLMDALTGTLIAAKEPDKPAAPASLTKIMTAYLVFDALGEGLFALEDTTVISAQARATSGSRMFIEANSEVSVRDLLLGLIVQSGNDAAVALAELVAGSEEAFVALMNQQAALLGMGNTTFGTATGLPAKGQQSTARDLAILSRAMIADFPELYQMHAVAEYEHNGILQSNRNRLLRQYRGADGIKTGYTRAAGYCLAASAVRHGMRLVGVVLDSASSSRRTAEMVRLFNHGFTHFRAVELFRPGMKLDEVKVWGGAARRVAVGYGDAEPLRMLLPKTEANRLKAVLENSGRPVEAPVAVGDQIATIRLMADDKTLASIPAVALEDVPPGPWWQRVSDYVRLYWLAGENERDDD